MVTDALVAITASMRTFQYSTRILALMRKRDMVGEMMLISDPSCNMRITDSITSYCGNKPRVLRRHPIEYTNGFLNSITNMIRPMNLGEMCFDCRMMSSFASALLTAVGHRDVCPTQCENQQWTQSFAEIITIDPYEYITST